MTRSFTDRVFGGVCGGLARALRLSPWLVRALFVVLTPLSLGMVALLYLILWWLLPQQSLARAQRAGGFTVLLALLAVIALAGLWGSAVTGALRGPAGQDLFVPAAMLLLSVAFFLRQVRA